MWWNTRGSFISSDQELTAYFRAYGHRNGNMSHIHWWTLCIQAAAWFPLPIWIWNKIRKNKQEKQSVYINKDYRPSLSKNQPLSRYETDLWLPSTRRLYLDNFLCDKTKSAQMCCITSCPQRLMGAPSGRCRAGAPGRGKGASHTRAHSRTYYARWLETLNKALRQIQRNHIVYQMTLELWNESRLFQQYSFSPAYDGWCYV